MRLLLIAAIGFLGLTALLARAQSDAATEIAQLRLELAGIQQEQQSVYQQFQMLRQLRSDLVQARNPQVIANPAVYPGGELPSYDDLARVQQQREDQIRQYDAKLKQLDARYKELEDNKKPIVDRVQQLTDQQ